MPILVALVEDDREARKILTGWIQHTPEFELVGEWGSGEAAIKELAAKAPEVVLMDINLPGISGVETITKLKPLLPKTLFVMLTVYEDADHIYSALAAGASGYLLKETPREDLFTALKDVYGGGSPMTSNIARKVVQSFQQKPRPEEMQFDLSPREREVLELLARGYLYKEIADNLQISTPTVNTYIRRIYEKLHVRSRSQAVAKYTYSPWH